MWGKSLRRDKKKGIGLPKLLKINSIDPKSSISCLYRRIIKQSTNIGAMYGLE